MDSVLGVLYTITIIVCVIPDVTPKASLRGPSPLAQNAAVQWGSSITLPCFSPALTQDPINPDECIVYWRKNGDNIATFYRGEVYYDSGLKESAALELGHDMALTIGRADWAWRGVVECIYAPKCDLGHENDLTAFKETRVNLNVEGSPLRVRECSGNSTDQCLLRVSQDTVTFNLTFVKEGALYDAVHVRRELADGMSVTSQSNLDWARNSDNSTTLQVSFEVNVESLKGSGEFTLILEDKNGRTLEETMVVLQKQSPPGQFQEGSSSSANYASFSLIMACLFSLMLIR